VFAKIGEEQFRLEPIDPMNDVPNYVESTFKALDLMKDRRDYENLIGLLEGMNRAKAKTLQKNYYGKLARKLAEAGRQDILLECIRQASRTGFTLTQYDRAKQVLGSMSQKAYAYWDAEDTEKALRWSEQILDLMEDPIHAPEWQSGRDAQNDPILFGRALELAAMRASKHKDGKDVDGKVEYFAKKVLGSLSSLRPVPQNPEESEGGELPLSAWRSRNSWLSGAVPLLYGMKVAHEVLDSTSKVAIQLKNKAAKLETIVKLTHESLLNSEWGKRKPRASLVAYEKKFGSQS
jgi:hypothetical protein